MHSTEKRIAIQGYQGSFHHKAAQEWYGQDIDFIPCDTFYQLIQTTENKDICDGALMAIENSLAGSILPNYFLLQNTHHLSIQGEIYLQINQHLLVNPGVHLTDIQEVHSHHMAIQQCLQYLHQYPHWKLVETADTALSAKYIAQSKTHHIAAIASDLAAKLLHLNIISPNIHSKKDNYTRFLVLQQKNILHTPYANKASIYFHTDHSQGSLSKVLNIMTQYGINMSKLQSIPIPGTQFKYAFHADIEFDHLDIFFKVIEKLRPKTESILIFGIYKKGNWIY
ncbi:MAG: prephenate dehydratase [Chitinophagaceae bacterium]